MSRDALFTYGHPARDAGCWTGAADSAIRVNDNTFTAIVNHSGRRLHNSCKAELIMTEWMTNIYELSARICTLFTERHQRMSQKSRTAEPELPNLPVLPALPGRAGRTGCRDGRNGRDGRDGRDSRNLPGLPNRTNLLEGGDRRDGRAHPPSSFFPPPSSLPQRPHWLLIQSVAEWISSVAVRRPILRLICSR